MNKLIAFHGDEGIKQKYLTRIRAHREADELIKGTYWENGKGCAVGCTVHSSRHEDYETELGIPRSLARIEDGIFEGLANGEAKLWPEKFLSVVKPGTDLSGVTDRFLHWLLVDPVDGVIRFAKSERSRKAIENVGALYARKLAGETISPNEWRAAYAYAAADAADAADTYAADAYAADAADTYAAYAAADAADAADTYAAYAAADAAAAAADAADTYAAADAAYAYAAADAAYARSKARARQAEKLLELLSACNGTNGRRESEPSGSAPAHGKTK